MGGHTQNMDHKKGFPPRCCSKLLQCLRQNWYSQLKSVHTAYRNTTTPIQILGHLNSQWCPLDVHSKKNLRMPYYVDWDREQNLAAIGKRLNNNQVHIKRYGTTISNEDKLQCYLKQMYALNNFDKKEMTKRENNPKAIKNRLDKAMIYSKGLIRDYKVYKQNSGNTAGKHNFESANQASEANHNNKLRQYIARIAKAVVAQEEQAANIHNSTKVTTDAMTAQIKAMSDQIAQLTRAIANKENVATVAVAAAAAAVAAGTKDKPVMKRFNITSHTIWVATVHCMACILPARTT
jgi:hypothetical protein